MAAFAARNEIMDHLAPLGAVYQAGTLSGNPLAMSAGLAMLTEIEKRSDVFESLGKKTAYLHEGLDRVLTQAGIPHQITSVSRSISMRCSPEGSTFPPVVTKVTSSTMPFPTPTWIQPSKPWRMPWRKGKSEKQ